MWAVLLCAIPVRIRAPLMISIFVSAAAFAAVPMKRVDLPLPPPPPGMKLMSRLIDEAPPPKDDAAAPEEESEGPSELDEMHAAEDANLEPEGRSDAQL